MRKSLRTGLVEVYGLRQNGFLEEATFVEEQSSRRFDLIIPTLLVFKKQEGMLWLPSSYGNHENHPAQWIQNRWSANTTRSSTTALFRAPSVVFFSLDQIYCIWTANCTTYKFWLERVQWVLGNGREQIIRSLKTVLQSVFLFAFALLWTVTS